MRVWPECGPPIERASVGTDSRDGGFLYSVECSGAVHEDSYQQQAAETRNSAGN